MASFEICVCLYINVRVMQPAKYYILGIKKENDFIYKLVNELMHTYSLAFHAT